MNPERVRWTPNPFRVNHSILLCTPGFSLHSNPGLKLANAFGVIVFLFGVIVFLFGVIVFLFGVIVSRFGVIVSLTKRYPRARHRL
jgi:hypothetical protein